MSGLCIQALLRMQTPQGLGLGWASSVLLVDISMYMLISSSCLAPFCIFHLSCSNPGMYTLRRSTPGLGLAPLTCVMWRDEKIQKQGRGHDLWRKHRMGDYVATRERERERERGTSPCLIHVCAFGEESKAEIRVPSKYSLLVSKGENFQCVGWLLYWIYDHHKQRLLCTPKEQDEQKTHSHTRSHRCSPASPYIVWETSSSFFGRGEKKGE